MKYSHTRLCRGYSKKYGPCKYIDSCELCVGSGIDDNSNECYIIGMGCNDIKCKRDNPNYKPMTKQQFIEFYKKMPSRTNTSLGELLECARIDGMVEE